MTDIRTTDHPLLFMYLGCIMYHGISFEAAVDSMHEKILNADYEDEVRGVEDNGTKTLIYIEEVLCE